MDHHLASDENGNSRNGYGKKTVITEGGKLALEIPRDRQSTFDPQLVAKCQRRFPGFDGKIISMYARGMSTREIVGHLRELVSAHLSRMGGWGRAPLRGVDVTGWAAIQAPGDRTS
jgi:putative transposase